MDAQYRSEHGCQQHLQRHRNPAHKQPYGYATGDRPAIQMPHHWLGKGVSNPRPKPLFIFFAASDQIMQLATKGRGIGQAIFKPVTRHGRSIWSAVRSPVRQAQGIDRSGCVA